MFETLGVPPPRGDLESRSPIDGLVIGSVASTPAIEVAAAVGRAHDAFLAWRSVPPPRRGELVRLFGEVLRAEKDALGRLVSLESGKILAEGVGEVQEMIDICDFAVGLSRQLYGLTIATERPGRGRSGGRPRSRRLSRLAAGAAAAAGRAGVAARRGAARGKG